MKLNARQVDTAKPKDKPYKLADGGGLYLLIKPNGGKYWRLKYRVAGKEKLLALGVYPEVTLADARAKREEAKRGIAGGNFYKLALRHRVGNNKVVFLTAVIALITLGIVWLMMVIY